MKLGVQDQGEDQRGPGKRLFENNAVDCCKWRKVIKYVDQDGCERVNVSSGTGLPGLSRTNGR